MKKCSVCEQMKYLREYYPSKRIKSGKASACKSCLKNRRKKNKVEEYAMICAALGIKSFDAKDWI